jgi:hypothetical protein
MLANRLLLWLVGGMMVVAEVDHMSDRRAEAKQHMQDLLATHKEALELEEADNLDHHQTAGGGDAGKHMGMMHNHAGMVHGDGGGGGGMEHNAGMVHHGGGGGEMMGGGQGSNPMMDGSTSPSSTSNFCSGMPMVMGNGFFATSQPCLVFMVDGWVLNTRFKYIAAVLATFALAFGCEWLRANTPRAIPASRTAPLQTDVLVCARYLVQMCGARFEVVLNDCLWDSRCYCG